MSDQTEWGVQHTLATGTHVERCPRGRAAAEAALAAADPATNPQLVHRSNGGDWAPAR